MIASRSHWHRFTCLGPSVGTVGAIIRCAIAANLSMTMTVMMIKRTIVLIAKRQKVAQRNRALKKGGQNSEAEI